MTRDYATTSITLKDLTKRFGSTLAVDDVNLEVEAGTLICLLGPSGCGKTTTLRMIGGFEEPTNGRVYIGEDDVTELPPYSRPTAMVFQSYALFPHMNVYENIAYGLKTRRLPKAEIKQSVGDVVALMELEGQEKKAPPQLSGGQRQRVALARALVIRPKVLLFDEPLSNLDALLRVRMRVEIRSVQQRLGITSVYVTHDQEEAFSISDQVALMNEGRLVQLGQPLELYNVPADRFVAEFVGLSNIVPVEVLEASEDDATVSVLGQTLHSCRPPRSTGNGVSVVLRPEALHIRAHDDKGVSARVITMSFLGPLIRYTVGVDNGPELIVDMHNPSADDFFAEGTAVSLQLPDEVEALLGG
jgi:iron(III) transport system ATP-binding protein